MGRRCGSVTRGGPGRHGGMGFPSAAQGTGQQARSRRACGPLSGRVAQAAIRGNNSEKSQLNSARMPGHCRRRQSAADVSSLSFRGRPAQQLAAVGRCDARPGNCRGRRAMDPGGQLAWPVRGAKADSARVQRGLGGACRRDSPSEGSDSGSSSDWFSELLPTESSAPEGPPGAP